MQQYNSLNDQSWPKFQSGDSFTRSSPVATGSLVDLSPQTKLQLPQIEM